MCLSLSLYLYVYIEFVRASTNVILFIDSLI